MQGLRCQPVPESVCLELSPAAATLSIDAGESPDKRIKRLISEHPVIIFSRSSCCMCHVMKRLLSTIGVHPTVIELEEAEMNMAFGTAAPSPPPHNGSAVASPSPPMPVFPAVFIGGSLIGGLETLMALHLSGHLVPKLREVGALWM